VGGQSADTSGIIADGTETFTTITGSIAYVSATSVQVTLTVGDKVTDSIVVSDFDYGDPAQTYNYQRTFSKFSVGTVDWGTDVDFAIDNVLVSTAIPEPSSYAILTGLLAAGFVVTRRRK